MTFRRGSLRQAVVAAYSAFRINGYDTIAITRHTAGKYYTIHNGADLSAFIEAHNTSWTDLVLHCTKRELEEIAHNEQLRLFTETKHDHDQTDN